MMNNNPFIIFYLVESHRIPNFPDWSISNLFRARRPACTQTPTNKAQRNAHHRQ